MKGKNWMIWALCALLCASICFCATSVARVWQQRDGAMILSERLDKAGRKLAGMGMELAGVDVDDAAAGDEVRRSYALPEFRAVAVASGVEVRLVPEGDSIVATGPDRWVDRLVVECSGDELCIRLKPMERRRRRGALLGGWDCGRYGVQVTVPTDGRLRALACSTSARLVAELPIEGDELDVSASTSGVIKARLKAQECRIECATSAEVEAEVEALTCSVGCSTSGQVEGRVQVRTCEVWARTSGEVELAVEADTCGVGANTNGSITLTGHVGSLAAEAMTSGEIEARRMECGVCNVAVATSGTVTVYAKEQIDARADTGGTVRYAGNPDRVECVERTGGTVKRL